MGKLIKNQIEEIKELFSHEIIEVASKEEAEQAIINHFGTFKVQVDEGNTKNGELWEVYPPSGVSSTVMYILIKN